jgi:hypothetical protein
VEVRRLVAPAVWLVAWCLAPPAVAAAQLVNVSSSAGGSRMPHMALDDAGTLHVVDRGLVDARPTGPAGCVSNVGAFDMVGNLWEWVADRAPPNTGRVAGLFEMDDANCLAGADPAESPGAATRGRCGRAVNAGFSAISSIVATLTHTQVGLRGAR